MFETSAREVTKTSFMKGFLSLNDIRYLTDRSFVVELTPSLLNDKNQLVELTLPLLNDKTNLLN